MSITAVNEIMTQRGGKKDENGSTVTRMFQVFSDDVTDNAIDIIDGGITYGLPDINEDLPGTDTLWSTLIDPRVQSGDGLIWTVRVEYKEKPGGTYTPTGGSEPWELEPVIAFGHQMRSNVFENAYALAETIAAAGTIRNAPSIPVQNSAGQDFDPPVMIDEALLIISIQRNVHQSGFNPNDLKTFVNTINSKQEVIAGVVIPQYEGCVRAYKSTKAWTSNNDAYWAQNIEILVDNKTFLKNILDRGFYELLNYGSPSSPSELERITDDAGEDLVDAVNLDGEGIQTTQDTPYYMEYHGYWEQNWDGLGLPSGY